MNISSLGRRSDNLGSGLLLAGITKKEEYDQEEVREWYSWQKGIVLDLLVTIEELISHEEQN